MNFLLHRHLAARDLASPAAGIGAMLPDLWRMADRRVRVSPVVSAPETPGPVTEVLAGVRHHLALDRWFHAAAVFIDGERLALERLKNAGPDVPKLALFAHVTWELCLDGALLRRQGVAPTAAALRDGLAAVAAGPVQAAAATHHFDRVPRTADERSAFDQAMVQLFRHVSDESWIGGYLTGTGIARRIDGMRARLGLGRFTPPVAARIAAAIDTLGPDADARLDAVLRQNQP